MTPEKLQEAIGLLPSDLVAEADKKRNQLPKRKPQWKRFAAMAACFCLVLACGLFLTRMGMGGSSKSAAPEMAPQAAPEAPAAAAPEYSLRDEAPAEEAVEEEAAPVENGAGITASPNDFALKLLQSSHIEGENTLVSPLSVFSALAMTAGGAQGQTLEQMEAVLGMPAGDMAPWVGSYLSGDALRLANGIWFTEADVLTLEESFLESSRADYQAELRQAPMNQDTCNDINRWVSDKTDGMIPFILDQIPEDAMLYLVNALAFDARWEKIYYDHQLNDGIFTTEDGRMQDMVLMHSKERLYLETDTATGFIKPYEDGRYGFAVLLPKEGLTLQETLDSLTGNTLQALLSAPEEAIVTAAMPKFETDFDVELSESLSALGMTDAFDATAADFSAMGTCTEGNLHISRVRHKTFLSVAEEGTKAGAATVIEMAMGAAMNPDIKYVTLDRPFLYMIVDMEQGFPIFFGTMEDMAA